MHDFLCIFDILKTQLNASNTQLFTPVKSLKTARNSAADNVQRR